MKRWQLLILFMSLSVCATVNVHAGTVPSYDATLTLTMHTAETGATDSTEVPVTYQKYGEDGGKWHIGPFEWNTPEGTITNLRATLDPDPSILFSGTAIDPGAPSSFSFVFTMPLIPNVSNPSIVLDSLSGSVTNGPAGGGVTVTALAPPAFIPVDGDGAVELQVYTLSDDGGLTWKNVGLDAGLTTVVPLAAFGSGDYGSYNQGPIATIAGGPWTHMRVDLNFGLSGGGDIFTFNGAKVLVPEPSAIMLALLALTAFCGKRRHVR